MPHAPARRWTDLFAPMSLAAYAAWAAVWFSVDGAETLAPGLGLAARVCTVAFLVVFVAEDQLSSRLGPAGFALVGALLAGLALVPAAAAPNSAAPILLVLLSAMLAVRYDGAVLWAWLAAINLALAAVMWRFWPGRDYLWITWLAYCSFQGFAALVMRYAAQAESAGEAVRAANADLLATRSLLAESARDSERLRLSRELHDVAGHKLTALKLNLGALARDPRFAGDDGVQTCARLADELLADIRGVVQQMREGEGMELGAALASLGSSFPRPRLQLQVDEGARADSLAQAEAVLRAVQEGLTNAARHSQAQTLWVVLQRERGGLRLDIRDDGRGRGELAPGNGLRGMRERIEGLGGRFDCGRTDTGGVHLQAWLPPGPA